MSPRLHFFLGSVLFLVAAGFALVAILSVAKLRFPRQPDLFNLLMRQGGSGVDPNSGRGLLQRLMQRWRNQPHVGGQSRRQGAAERATRDFGGKGTAGNAYGTPGRELPEDQLALRETAEASQILSSQYHVDPEEGWRRFRQVPVQGPFQQFERERFLSGVLMQRYFEHPAEKRDPLVMQQLHSAITQAVARPEADFEEFFTAGVAYLYRKDPVKAEEYLSRAENAWPCPGRAYGDVYLTLTWTYAIEGQSAEVLRRLEDFKTVYPDWLYIETYMPDLDDLRKIYPGTPLLEVVRGRLLYQVGNYAEAEAAWTAALPKLDAVAGSTVRRWLLDVRREAKP